MEKVLNFIRENKVKSGIIGFFLLGLLIPAGAAPSGATDEEVQTEVEAIVNEVDPAPHTVIDELDLSYGVGQNLDGSVRPGCVWRGYAVRIDKALPQERIEKAVEGIGEEGLDLGPEKVTVFVYDVDDDLNATPIVSPDPITDFGSCRA